MSLPFEVCQPQDIVQVTRVVILILLQLKNKDLFKNKAYVDGKWIDAPNGKTFEVFGTKAEHRSTSYATRLLSLNPSLTITQTPATANHGPLSRS